MKRAGVPNIFLITNYPQPSSHGTKQEHTTVSADLSDGAQQGAISKGAQRGPVCCSLRNRGSVPGGGDALALAIRLCLPGLRRGVVRAFRVEPEHRWGAGQARAAHPKLISSAR